VNKHNKSQTTENATGKNGLNQIIDRLLFVLNTKQRNVLISRFGLKNGIRSTLQDIGDEFDITRERVRQIEEQAIKKVKEAVKAEAGELVKLAENHLLSSGGIREDELFLKELNTKSGFSPKEAKHFEEKLRFVLSVAGSPFYYKEDEKYASFWYSNEMSKKNFFEFVNGVVHNLRSGDKTKILTKKEYIDMCPDMYSCHLLSIPKIFGTNAFGEFGLREWAEIEPRTVRDKAYLVLKKKSSPLHFKEIANNICTLGIDKKPAHVQTVHNELIKDGRFVLVGRGVYALREHGYEPGTVREVITRLLKERGPLDSTEVVRLVNQKRFLKENTILLNLQNRRHFKRLEDGRYGAEEA